MILIPVSSYQPDFEAECEKCGTSPCVTIVGAVAIHEPDLCGPCYFEDPMMLDYWLWNEVENTYLPTLEEDEDD